MWFRLDLRLDDNPALHAVAVGASALIPLFIWAPEEEEPWPPGAASRWWLHQSLESLQRDLAARGSRLILRHGPSLETLQAVLKQTGAKAVYWNRRYEPAIIARDTRIKQSLRNQGFSVETFNASLVFEPWTIQSKSSKRPFQVFSAFWKACLNSAKPDAALDAPQSLRAPAHWPPSDALHQLSLEPRIDWAAGLRAAWHPGEAAANMALNRFVHHALHEYESERDRPDHTGTSRLSPHLHFGEVSVRRVWQQVRDLPGADGFLKELGWREFAYHLLFHFPATPDRPLRNEFALFPWRADPPVLKRWQRGRTGYPLVDAGMRELWATGWMHNRVRMVVASFLVKDLRISWEEGAYWFWDTLVDADLANNTLGWQWSAGCGADAAPYFRVFNPERQSERFDPEGEYIRRWIPELRRLPVPWIHAPWRAPGVVLDEARIKLGENYPRPVVDHDLARREALAAFEQIRRSK